MSTVMRNHAAPALLAVIDHDGLKVTRELAPLTRAELVKLAGAAFALCAVIDILASEPDRE